MSALLDLRKALADSLAGLGLNTYTHIPGRMTLPGAFVTAGSPYISEGQTFEESLIRFEVNLCVFAAENEAETSALDELIEGAVSALKADGWLVEEVSQPFIQDFNNTQALVIQITVSVFETI